MGNNSNEKLIVFDATSVLNDFYHKSLTKEFTEWKKGNLSKEDAFNSLLKSSDGHYINGVQGFFKLFFELIDIQNPSHLIVIWGSFKEKNFRNILYPNYKGSSTDLDYPLEEQFSTIKGILSKIGVVQYSSHKYESQDLAGSIARYFKDSIPTYIFTRNSNMLQIVNYAKVWIKTKDSLEFSKKFSLNLSCYPKDYILYDKELVSKIIGLNYNQITDYKAVVGNRNSGIPGAKGVGKESITPLLKYFNSIEEFYSKLETLNEDELNNFSIEIKEKLSLKKNPIKPLLLYKNEVLISKELTTIKTDIFSSLPIDKNPLKLSALTTNIDASILIDELRKIDLTPIIKKEIFSSKENIILSSLIQTYNPYILSPSSNMFIGNNISNIKNNNSLSINSIIYLPNIDNILNSRNSLVLYDNNYIKEKNTNIKTEDTLFDLYQGQKYIRTDNILISEEAITSNVDDTIIEDETIISDTDDILKTLPDNSLLKVLMNTDIINNSINTNYDTQISTTNGINNLNKEQFSLIDSFTVNKYKCSCCNTEFTVINSEPKFCTNCGFGKNDKNEIKNMIYA